MSRSETLPSLVVEWSPSAVTVYDPVTKRSATGSSLAEVASGISGRTALLAPSRKAFFLRTIRVPDASKDDLRAALTLTMGQHFPIVPGDLCFDFRLTDDVTPEGRLAIVAAMRATELRQLLTEAAAVGLRSRAVVPAAFGSYLLAEGMGQPSAAVVSPTAEGLAIDLVQGGQLRYSRVLAPGASLLGLDVELSRTFAAAGLPCAPTIAAAGAAVSESEFKTDDSPLDYLARTHSERIGIHLELPEVLAHRASRARASRGRMAMLVVAATLVLLAFLYLDRSSEMAKVNQSKARATQSLQGLKGHLATYQSDSDALKGMRDRMGRAFQPAQRLTDIATIVANLAPEGVWLTTINVERGKNIDIRGTAKTAEQVNAFYQRLSTEERLRGVKLLFSNNATIEKVPVVQFSISGFPVGNLPLVDPKGVKRS